MFVLKHIPTDKLVDVVSIDARTLIGYNTEADACAWVEFAIEPAFRKNYVPVTVPEGWTVCEVSAPSDWE